MSYEASILKLNNKKYSWKIYLKNKIKKFFGNFMKYGYERITIMFIPHSEKNVLNFQLSKFSIFFIFIFFITVIVTGSYFYLDVNQVRTVLDKKSVQLFEANNDLAKYSHLIPKLKNNSYELLGKLDNLKAIVGATGTNIQYKNAYVGGSSSKLVIDNYSQANAKLKQIQELRQLYYEMGIMAQDLEGLGKLLKGYKIIFDNMPSIFPLMGSNLGPGYITSHFGWRRDPFINKVMMHNGVDIINIPGTPVVATADGFVLNSDRNSGKGIYVALNHKFGFVTEYMHLSSSIVDVGQRVKKGQTVGYLGNTGRSTGPHLHYEVKINNISIDPIPFISLDKTRRFRENRLITQNKKN